MITIQFWVRGETGVFRILYNTINVYTYIVHKYYNIKIKMRYVNLILI